MTTENIVFSLRGIIKFFKLLIDSEKWPPYTERLFLARSFSFFLLLFFITVLPRVLFLLLLLLLLLLLTFLLRALMEIYKILRVSLSPRG